MHLIPVLSIKKSMRWESAITHTDCCELLQEVPNEIIRGVPIEALFAFVDHNHPPVAGDRPVKLLVDHVPLTVARLLWSDCQSCGQNCGSMRKHTIVGCRL